MTLDRALIVAKVGDTQYTVRIPTLNKSANAVGATPDTELYTASVNVSPGITPAYNAGDLVYVAFEKDDESAPVIIGALLNSNTINIQSDIHSTSLTVNTNVLLPADTQIGKVSAANIATLEGQTLRISDEFSRVDANHQVHSDEIFSLQNEVIYIREHRLVEIDNNISVTRTLLDQHIIEYKEHKDDYEDHKADEKRHVTEDEQNSWNAHLQVWHLLISDWDAHQLEWNTHKNDEARHVNADKQTSWNQHRDNDDIHVTVDNKNEWSSKAAGNHNHDTVYVKINPTSINLNTVILKEGTTYGTASQKPNNPAEGQLFFVLEA